MGVTITQTQGSPGGLSGNILPLATTILLPVSLSHINQVSITAGSVSTQVFDGKGSEKLVSVEDLSDNEFKG